MLAVFVLSLSVGEEALAFGEALTPGSSAHEILFGLRLPRVLLAALVGAALAAAGCVLQALLRNPLADPFVLGVSGGSGLGATLALAFGAGGTTLLGFSLVSASAFAGGVAATFLVLALGRLAASSRHAVVVGGVVFNTYALSAILFLKTMVAPDTLGSVLFWLAGSLGYEEYRTLGSAAVALGLAVAVMLAGAWKLNVLSLGDDEAAALGVDVGRARLVLLLAASLAVAVSVSLAGLVGFVGLVVPYLARLAVGGDQRLALPVSLFGGAAFLMAADAGTRALFLVFKQLPPVGALTAQLGVPLFVWLLVRRERLARGDR